MADNKVQRIKWWWIEGMSLYIYCRFVNGANEYGLAKGHKGSIMAVTGKVTTIKLMQKWLSKLLEMEYFANELHTVC